jgi:hypothetical protein
MYSRFTESLVASSTSTDRFLPPFVGAATMQASNC